MIERVNELMTLPDLPADWLGEGDALPGDPDWLDLDAVSLLDTEIALLDANRCLDTLASLRRVRALADALEARTLVRFGELRGEVRGVDQEVAYELRVSRRAAKDRIGRAQRLVSRHPRALAAMEDGQLDGYAAGRIAEITSALSDELARKVDGLIAGKLDNPDPVVGLRAARQAVIAVDPDGERDRARVARQARGVDLVPGENSMSTLYANLPAETAAACYASIDTAARALRRNGEPRTLEQLRADILAERIIGGIDGVGGGKVSPGAMVYLHMPITTALSITDDGAELEGYGPIPASIARQIMADEKSIWRRVLCDPASGAVLDVGRSRYRPPAAVREVVATRDRECAWPGCHRPAGYSAFDHVQARRKGGPTSVANGEALCAYHNNLKEDAGWKIHRDDAAAFATVTTPSGRVYVKECETVLRPRFTSSVSQACARRKSPPSDTAPR